MTFEEMLKNREDVLANLEAKLERDTSNPFPIIKEINIFKQEIAFLKEVILQKQTKGEAK